MPNPLHSLVHRHACFSINIALQPLFELAESPDAFLLIGRLGINDAADAMLHAIDPLAAVLATVRVGVHALAVLLIKLVVPLILPAVLPHIIAIPVHHAVLEAALKVAAI